MLFRSTVAIVVVDPDTAKLWGSKNGNVDTPDVVHNADFKAEVYDDILRLSKENKLSGLERPADIHLTLDAFTAENDILTPTFKLKRNIGKQVYQEQIDTMYKIVEEKNAKRDAERAM